MTNRRGGGGAARAAPFRLPVVYVSVRIYVLVRSNIMRVHVGGGARMQASERPDMRALAYRPGRWRPDAWACAPVQCYLPIGKLKL